VQDLVRVVGRGATAAIDAQCEKLQEEISETEQQLTTRQESWVLLQEALARKDAEMRALQRKLVDMAQRLQQLAQLRQQDAQRYSRLRTVHTENQKLKSHMAKILAALDEKENELQATRTLLASHAGRAGAIAQASHQEARYTGSSENCHTCGGGCSFVA
jgi:DNA repair exonuclease SbcCD ATPase subunit